MFENTGIASSRCWSSCGWLPSPLVSDALSCIAPVTTPTVPSVISGLGEDDSSSSSNGAGAANRRRRNAASSSPVSSAKDSNNNSRRMTAPWSGRDAALETVRET